MSSLDLTDDETQITFNPVLDCQDMNGGSSSSGNSSSGDINTVHSVISPRKFNMLPTHDEEPLAAEAAYSASSENDEEIGRSSEQRVCAVCKEGGLNGCE